MPFAFKLSRRCARFRTVVLMTTLATAACEFQRATSADEQVDRVELSPSAVTVQPNQTTDFTAVAFNQNSDTADVTVTWTATGGTVTDMGVQNGRHLGQYKHNVCGTFQVMVTTEPGGKSDSASVSVSCPVPVATVDVSPAATTVEVGRTVQLTATPKDANGNPLSGRTITWTSSDPGAATVNSSGLVTGVAVGSATITATSEGKSGTSAVTVIAPPPPPPPPPPGSGVVLVGAGDIANCGRSTDEATGRLLDMIPGTVFTAGDNAYPDGTASDFANCYEPAWGRHKDRTRPSPGNHDYHTSGASAYFDYFGANAGDRTKGYYSYDLGDWHIISLNSNISMSVGSTQEQWLRADLAASTKQCTLAYWHHPRFSSGSHGSSTSPKALWQALYDHDAEIVVSGHDHDYERFAPQTPDGVADPARGIREFIVGTGGTGLYTLGTPIANSEVGNDDTHGVIKFTLSAGSYTWEFVPVAGKTFTDSGSGSCH